MPRIRVYRFPGDEIEENELQALFEEADCEIVSNEVDEDPPDALIVVLTTTLHNDLSLENALREAVGAGLRVVCIWPKGVTTGTVPPAVEKYSADQVVWDPARLRQAITSEDLPYYDAPDGTPRSEPLTDRNKC